MFAPKDVEVWPENWPVIQLFTEMETQWRISMGGETGIDYMALFARMDRMSLDPERYEALFQDIRHMEREALRLMHQKT